MRRSLSAVDFARTHPAHYFFRVRPGREDLFRRCVEASLDGEAGFDCKGGGHVSSSKKAASWSNRSVQNFWYRLSQSLASRIGSALRRQLTMRPLFSRPTSPAPERTSRCFMTAGNDIE